MIRDLDDKKLGQNKVLYSSSGVELPWSITMHAPRQRSLCQEERFPTTRRLLALESHGFGFSLVASSLLLHLARVLARFSAVCSTFCWLPSLLFGKELDHWLSHGWSGVQRC